jgi:cation transport regulator ChaC
MEPEVVGRKPVELDFSSDVWLFGYGSLCWRAGFKYQRSLVGYAKGLGRRWHQASMDHRGTPEYPGRVLTLEPFENEVCWGAAYLLPKDSAAQIIADLDFRERGGYERALMPLFGHDSDTEPLLPEVLVYVSNRQKNYAGPADSLDELALRVLQAVGPSGPNADYVMRLAEWCRLNNVKDENVLSLEAALLRLTVTHDHLVPSTFRLARQVISSFQSTLVVGREGLSQISNWAAPLLLSHIVHITCLSQKDTTEVAGILEIPLGSAVLIVSQETGTAFARGITSYHLTHAMLPSAITKPTADDIVVVLKKDLILT